MERECEKEKASRTGTHSFHQSVNHGNLISGVQDLSHSRSQLIWRRNFQIDEGHVTVTQLARADHFIFDVKAQYNFRPFFSSLFTRNKA